ncbi:MAG: type II secretion system F family protein [Desulfatitalea sp.]|nr:type II secretion system F family protein [Desulfatitalea sp.]
MPIFSYQAINQSGATISGSLEAESLEAANLMLMGNGLIPDKVRVQKAPGLQRFFETLAGRLRPVRVPELILFTKQFRTMIRAGIPMLTLLRTLETQSEDPRLKKVVIAMEQDITRGASLHEAFRKHPAVFSPLYCSMVRAGEASGALPEVMDRLIYILEHEHKIRSEIRSALQYPAIVLAFLALAFFILLTYVIPKFSAIFLRSGLELPLLTRITIMIYDLFMAYWIIMAVVLVTAVTFLVLFLRTENGRLQKDTLLLNLPLLGPLFRKAAMARFASIFSILQSSGVAILDSMRILADTVNNSAIAREFTQLMERLEEGRGIAEPLRQSRYFTPIVINMTAIGEESGNLEEMLNEIAAHYDWELSHAVKRFNDSLGPILIVGMAIVIGFFALAIYMPMWDLSRVVR